MPRVTGAPAAPALVERFRLAVEAARDPVRAAGMAAYLRGRFPFAGIPAPGLTTIYRAAIAGLPPPAVEAEVAAVALACWDLPEREYQHLGGAHLRRHARLLGPAFVPVLERLVTTKSWWDTVDELATHVAGPLVAAHPELRSVIDRWIEADDLWLARVAILHQERWKERTDAALLFDYCVRRAGDRDFFIRKAIGWALREYAKTDPEAVRAFLARERGRFAPLTVREALKNIGA